MESTELLRFIAYSIMFTLILGIFALIIRAIITAIKSVIMTVIWGIFGVISHIFKELGDSVADIANSTKNINVEPAKIGLLSGIILMVVSPIILFVTFPALLIILVLSIVFSIGLGLMSIFIRD